MTFESKEQASCWYALFINPGEEEKVRDRINHRFSKNEKLKAIVPIRRIRERRQGVWEYKTRTLFPGFVLLNGCIGEKEFYLLKAVSGLFHMLKDISILEQIRGHEIDCILKLTGGGDVIGTSRGFMHGDRLEIIEGPLMGFEGFIDSINKRKGRARLKMEFMGQYRTIDLDISLMDTI